MVNCLSRAGAETQLVRLAIELRQLGHDVGVISILPPQDFTATLRDAGIPIVSLTHLALDGGGHGAAVPRTAVIRGLPTAVRTLRSWRCEALVCFIHEASLVGRVVGRIAGVDVVIGSERNVWREGRIDARISRWTDRLLTTTVVNTARVAEDLVRRRIVRPNRVEVIANGIDVADYQSPPERRAMVRAEIDAGDSFIWLAIGRLTPQKDYPTLLTAFAKVRNRRPDARLLVAGSGVLDEELAMLATRLGIRRAVMFLGERSDIADLLAATDGLVMSSESEGLPNAVLEAFAAGVPVVATAVGGVPELVKPGHTGMLVAVRDVDALADAMLELMAASADERARLGSNGHTMVRSRYGMAQIAQRWLDLITAHSRVRTTQPHGAPSGRPR